MRKLKSTLEDARLAARCKSVCQDRLAMLGFFNELFFFESKLANWLLCRGSRC